MIQRPCNFFLHFKKNLEATGFKQSTNDPCLFISKTVLCLVYVDDYLFFSRNQQDIDTAIDALKTQGMELNKEDDAAGFLGVQMTKQSNGHIILTQPGLINHVVEAVGVTSCNPKSTPSPRKALGRDLNGPPFDADFNYASVVGMMLYLCNNFQPDIAFAVSQCARYTHHPTAKHAQYLKHTAKYLKGTRTEGLILKPKGRPLHLQCYVDANFAGLWHKDDEADPHCVLSRSGWVITIGGCPIMLKSKGTCKIRWPTFFHFFVFSAK